MGLIQMHREANLTLPLKGQMSTYNNSFSNFGRPLVPDDLCKDSAPKLLGSGEKDFQRFLPYMGMAAILVNEPRQF